MHGWLMVIALMLGILDMSLDSRAGRQVGASTRTGGGLMHTMDGNDPPPPPPKP